MPTAQSYLGYYSVKDAAYGAVGDGVTDDTAAIQAAINAAAAFGTDASVPYQYKGACVVLPAGTYLVTQLTMKHHVTLMGVGAGSVLFQKAATAQSAMIICDPHALFVRIQHLRIDGNCANQTQAAGTGPHGIYFDYSASYDPATDEESDPYPHIHDVEIYNVNGTGIFLKGRGESQVSGVMGRNILGDGLNVSFDAHITNCSFGVIGGAGVNIGNNALGGSVRMSNVKCFHCGNQNLSNTEIWSTSLNGGSGFYIFNSQAVTLSNCEAQDCAGAGFNLNTVLDSTLTNCTADSVSAALGGDPGFNLANCHRNLITGHVRDRGPSERTGETIGGSPSHYAVRYAVRSWFIDSGLGAANNIIRLTMDLNSGLANYCPVYPKSENSNATEGNGEYVVIQNQEGNQTIAYAPTITPNPYDGGTIFVGTLTGNITVANVAAVNRHVGVRMTLVFTQDGTGGWTIGFDTGYKYSWTPNTGIGKINSISFVWNGSNWIQVAAATGM